MAKFMFYVFFLDGFTPYDSSQKRLEPQAVAIELYIVFSIAASIGILLGIMFLVFNRYYRKYRQVYSCNQHAVFSQAIPSNA